MKIIYKKPPIWDEVVKKFNIEGKAVIFAYGDNIYNPFYAGITDDLMVHEETHLVQQKKIGSPEIWWKKYLEDPEFRLSQEVEAYGNQYKYAQENYGRQQRKGLLKRISKELAGPIYGNLVNKNEAKDLIENKNENTRNT